MAWHWRERRPRHGAPAKPSSWRRSARSCGAAPLRVLRGKQGRRGPCKPGANKGAAAGRWLGRGPYDLVLAAGDDTTDEDLFAALPARAWSLRVGLGETRARFSLQTGAAPPPRSSRARLGSRRSRAREPRPTYPPISDYALLSDAHTAALLSSAGSVDWLCLPRFDSPAVFARLLDAEGGGHFELAVPDATSVRRRYLPDTNVVETVFTARKARRRSSTSWPSIRTRPRRRRRST